MIAELLAAAVLGAAAADSASPDTARFYAFPEVRVEADRWAPERNAVPLATTTIDRKTIESSGAVSAGDLLRALVGIRVASLGGLGSFTPVSIRGSSNEQVVVLLDGRRLNRAQGGGVDFGDLPVDGVERIEVARGGASALYGPEAIGGAINFISRVPSEGRSARLRGEVGSFGTRNVSGEAAGASERASFRLNGRFLDSRGDYTFRDGAAGTFRRENGEISSRGLSGLFALRSANGPLLELRAGHDRSSRGIPGVTEFPSPTAVQTDERSHLSLGMPVAPDFGLPLLGGSRGVTALSAFGHRQFRRYEDPEDPFGAVDESHRNEAYGFGLERKQDFGAAGLFTLNADFREDHLGSTTDGRRVRPARGVAARHMVSGGRTRRWSVIPAVRWDDVADFNAAWSPRILARIEVVPDLTARGSIGRSFRPPSFDDLFFPARASAAGNPDLAPERASDFDLGLSAERGAWSAGVTVFHSRVTDLIQWQPGAAGIWRPHNVSGASISGIETEVRASLAIPGFAEPAWVQANYTFLRPRDAGNDPNTGGRDLVYRPRHRANLELRVPRGRFTAETAWRYTGPVFTTRANTKTLPGYLVGDAALLWQATGSTAFELRSLNVTNAEYQDIRDYPVPGRQWRLAAVWKTGEGS